MYIQKTWWYSKMSEIQVRILRQSVESMKAEERLELRRVLQETIRLVDNLGRKA